MRPVRSRGFSLVEVMIALAILAATIIIVFQMNFAAMGQMSQSRQRSIARLAAISARESLETQQFRRLSSSLTDPLNESWFMKGTQGTASKFPVAYRADGSPYLFPDIAPEAAGLLSLATS